MSLNRLTAFWVGHGQGRWLYAVVWLLVAALWPVHAYLRSQGVGPDGGDGSETSLTLLMLIALAWMIVGAVNAIRLARRLRMPGWIAGLLAPLSGVATMALAFILTLAWPPDSFGGFLLVTALFAGPNLLAMALIRRL